MALALCTSLSQEPQPGTSTVKAYKELPSLLLDLLAATDEI